MKVIIFHDENGLDVCDGEHYKFGGDFLSEVSTPSGTHRTFYCKKHENVDTQISYEKF